MKITKLHWGRISRAEFEEYSSNVSFFLFDKKSSEYTQFVKDDTRFKIKLVSIVVLDVKHKLPVTSTLALHYKYKNDYKIPHLQKFTITNNHIRNTKSSTKQPT